MRFPAFGKVVKTIPVWIKYGERGKVKGAGGKEFFGFKEKEGWISCL